MAVLRYTEQPGSKGRSARVETIYPPGRDDEDLLRQLLCHVMPGARKRQAKPINRIEVPLEQLPPCLFAAALSGVYHKYLGIGVHSPVALISAYRRRSHLYNYFFPRPQNPSPMWKKQ
jgi:hypothetical protein